MTLLSFFWLFGLLAMLHRVLDSNFVLFLSMDSSSGRLRNQVVSFLV
jgi:hypothetical protein